MVGWWYMAGHSSNRRKHGHIRLLVIVVISVILLVHSWEGNTRTLRFVTLEYPPYQYLEDNNAKGIGVNMVNEVFNRMDKSFVVEFLPWGRALREVQAARADGIFTIYFSEERQKSMLFSQQVLINQSVSIFSKRDSGLKLTGNINELRQLRVGLVRNVSYGKEIDSAIAQGIINKVVETTSGTQSFRLLLADRVDVVISNQLGGVDILRRLNIQQLVQFHREYEFVIPSYFAFPKTWRGEKLKQQFDTTLRKMKSDGTYEAVLAQSLRCNGNDCKN
ncbi:substrate-binding periplasmic protein [Pseudoalteromonas obscura]|uniref:Transporter substrate-binding domain-containing protein n=1 Tax=Pseudoalteromonas obscura TaxID=3048491 RepID=A0ABT7EMD9_9GAMM|nr:transporter substrate-binding domain-containing protein [Pseudoalteromonas sp. P94(2023)]MDK2596188.1 transporter substrate-binding domain-containing protein [Pseudoalteromonas sp. P94(2023)]